jgi:hypothetical protein
MELAMWSILRLRVQESAPSSEALGSSTTMIAHHI